MQLDATSQFHNWAVEAEPLRCRVAIHEQPRPHWLWQCWSIPTSSHQTQAATHQTHKTGHRWRGDHIMSIAGMHCPQHSLSRWTLHTWLQLETWHAFLIIFVRAHWSDLRFKSWSFGRIYSAVLGPQWDSKLEEIKTKSSQAWLVLHRSMKRKEKSSTNVEERIPQPMFKVTSLPLQMRKGVKI